MPSRILREGILESYAVNALDESAEIFYRRLMSVVDDFGIFYADERLLLSRLFALQLDRWTIMRVQKALIDVCQMPVNGPSDDGHTTDTCQTLVRVYSVNNKKFLEINKFRQRTRSGGSKFPRPSDPLAVMCRSIDGQLTVTCRSIDGHMTAQSESESLSLSESLSESESLLSADKNLQAVPLPSSTDQRPNTARLTAEEWEQPDITEIASRLAIERCPLHWHPSPVPRATKEILSVLVTAANPQLVAEAIKVSHSEFLATPELIPTNMRRQEFAYFVSDGMYLHKPKKPIVKAKTGFERDMELAARLLEAEESELEEQMKQ